MRKYFQQFSLIITLCLLAIILTSLVIAGTITPPTATPTPTGHTLGDIYNFIHNNNTSVEGDHSLSPAIPTTATSSYSISQIYADLTNLIHRENVATGTAYLGVIGSYDNPDPAYATTTVIISSLTPTTISPQATGYTLEDIYNLIHSNTTTTPGSHTFVAGTPASSMYSINTIYTDLVALGISKASYVRSGQIYLGQTGSYVPPDITLPVVTSFSIPTTSSSTTVPINTFTATDNIAVTGYLINESATPPLAGDVGWTGTATTTYTFSSEGSKTLYAWAKDAAGNVSALYTGQSVVITLDSCSHLATDPDCWSVGVSGRAWGPYNTVTGVQNTTDGAANTATLAGLTDSYPAADYCDGLDQGGHQDWYLPAKDQLWSAWGEPWGGLVGFPGGRTWSSTEGSSNPGNDAWILFTTGSGFMGTYSKGSLFYVRCLR